LQNVSFASPTELVGCARPEQALARNIASKQVVKSSQRRRKVGSRRATEFYNKLQIHSLIFGSQQVHLVSGLPRQGIGWRKHVIFLKIFYTLVFKRVANIAVLVFVVQNVQYIHAKHIDKIGFRSHENGLRHLKLL